MNLARLAAVAALVIGSFGTASAQALSDAERSEIQQLTNRVLGALNGCAAEEYAGLYTPDGYFESAFRGRLQGREKLIELVRSERHCAPGAAPRTAGATQTMIIQPSPGGAIGTMTFANDAGAAEERYVKTAQGWRMASRTVWTGKELASKTGPVSSAK